MIAQGDWAKAADPNVQLATGMWSLYGTVLSGQRQRDFSALGEQVALLLQAPPRSSTTKLAETHRSSLQPLASQCNLSTEGASQH